MFGILCREEKASSSLIAQRSADPQSRRQMKFRYANGDQPLAGFTIKRGVELVGFGEVYFAGSTMPARGPLKQIQRNLDVEVRGVRQCMNLKHPNLDRSV